VKGYEATISDLTLCTSIEASVMNVEDLTENFPHVYRWWRHVASLRRDGLVGQVSLCMMLKLCFLPILGMFFVGSYGLDPMIKNSDWFSVSPVS